MKVFTSYLLTCLHVSAHAFVVLFRLRHFEVNSRGCIKNDTAPLSLEFSIADYYYLQGRRIFCLGCTSKAIS